MELTGREISNELTHVGFEVSNITSTINGLRNRKPALMIQTRKEGKSAQSQKRYKVTDEGLKAAKALLSQTVERNN